MTVKMSLTTAILHCHPICINVPPEGFPQVLRLYKYHAGTLEHACMSMLFTVQEYGLSWVVSITT